MYSVSHKSSTRRSTSPRPNSIKTTLYEVIDAISNEVDAEEEKLIPKIVLHLANSGKIKSIGNHLRVVAG